MHLLATVLVAFDAERAAIRPVVARDAAAWARLDMLLYRHEQADDDLVWGVETMRGFMFDWWALGGRWNGWGRCVHFCARPRSSRRTASGSKAPRFFQVSASPRRGSGKRRRPGNVRFAN